MEGVAGPEGVARAKTSAGVVDTAASLGNGRPIIGIVVVLVLVAAMFMPWGTVPITKPIRTGESLTFDAWHGWVTLVGISIPDWTSFVLAGAAVLVFAFWPRPSRRPPLWLVVALLLASIAQCAWVTLVLALSSEGIAGFGSAFAALVGIAYLIYAASRKRNFDLAPA
jgi:hypothetical protein